MLKGQLALFGGEEDYKEPGAAFCRRQERRDSNFLWLVSIFTTERWSITIYYPWEAWNGTFIIWDKTDLCYGLFLPKNQFVQWLKNIENGTGCAGCWVSAQKCYQCYQFPDSQWFLWKSNDGIFLSKPFPEFICDTRDSELTATSPPMMFLTWDFEKWACYFRFWLTPGRSVLTYYL